MTDLIARLRAGTVTPEQAIAIAEAIRSVDGGCPPCIKNLCADMNEVGLGWVWKMREDEHGKAVYSPVDEFSEYPIVDVTPADLDAAADAIERRNRALVWIAENGKRGVAGGYLCAQVAAKALSK